MALFLPPPVLWRRCFRELLLASLVLLSGSYLIHSFYLLNSNLDITDKVHAKKLAAQNQAIDDTTRRAPKPTFGQQVFVNNGAEFNPTIRGQATTKAPPVKYRVRTGAGAKFESGAKQPANYSADTDEHVPVLHVNFECPAIRQAENDFDSESVYPTLEFENPQIWGTELEDLYKVEELASINSPLALAPPLRVIVVPHSHNDPGWGWTLDSYYYAWTKRILNLALEKLTEYKEMTFLWSEVAFLDIWWKTATAENKRRFKALVREGRLELTTGGWVMTDEAVVHLYAMLHQLIEGQEWLQHNVGVMPVSAWSVDPFGFGPVMPYLLKESQIDSMVIMRIHHAWKHWLASQKKGDFRWGQRWNPDPSHAILCHQSPFALYTISASLGPDNDASYKFNFIEPKVAQVTRWNVSVYAAEFLEQARRSGSLSQHNTAMAILGDDFRFRNATEWDNAYTSFTRIFDEINSNPERYGDAKAQFGTVKTFFEVVRERQPEPEFPLFNGDFFVYSDGLTDEVSGNQQRRGSYWSGFYGSRPFYKQLYRELEANLRSAEILFAFIKMKSLSPSPVVGAGAGTSPYAKCFSTAVARRLFKRLQIARRHLALFAHHDAAPGVSTDEVMLDYGRRLHEAVIHSVNVQTMCVTCLTIPGNKPEGARALPQRQRPLVTSALSFPIMGLPRSAIPLDLGGALQNATTARTNASQDSVVIVAVEKHILVWNSLAWPKLHYVAVLVTSAHVQVYGPDGRLIPSQLSPAVMRPRKKSRLPEISNSTFELGFYYTLEAASVTKFKIVARTRDEEASASRAFAFAGRAIMRYRNLNESSIKNSNTFETRTLAEDEEFSISNARYKLSFNPATGFLASARLLPSGQPVKLNLTFGGYTPMRVHDGPYLFMPKDEMHADADQNAFATGAGNKRSIVVIEGPLMASVLVQTPTLSQVVKIFRPPADPPSTSSHAAELASMIAFSNAVNVDEKDGEYFMRFDTDIKNGDVDGGGPVLFTDQSGFSFEKRTTISKIALEGNTYPITTMAYIQDGAETKPGERQQYQRLRMTLLVGRAHGASSFVPGRLELLIERRTPYDDNRGIGQGILDNRPTVSNYILKLECIDGDGNGGDDEKGYQATLPTLETHHASQRLNYPAQVFYYDEYSDDQDNEEDGEGEGEKVSGKESEMDAFRQISLFNQPIPSDTHLLGLRTKPGWDSLRTPSDNKVLMILQKFGYSCFQYWTVTGTGLYSSVSPTNFFHILMVPSTKNTTTLNVNIGPFNTESSITVKKMDLTGLRSAKEEPDGSGGEFFGATPFQISSFQLIFQ